MLNEWNKLEFSNEEEYYVTLGFLSKQDRVIDIITEANEKAGAGGTQGKLRRSALLDMESLPAPLRNAFECSKETRASETKYIRNLQIKHGFTKEIDNLGNDFTKHILPNQIEDVLITVPQKYIGDFYRGYHWSCEIKKRCRNIELEEVNEDNDSTEEIVDGNTEGRKKVYYTTKYERNSKNREAAIRIHGTKCMICGFDYEKKYGDLGKNYIEVHHIKPLSTLEEEIIIDPENYLVCVCANCHRMLHRFKNYMVSIEELRTIVRDN